MFVVCSERRAGFGAARRSATSTSPTIPREIEGRSDKAKGLALKTCYLKKA
jgi:hypothetical protein